jgi:hypothetical protein
MLKLNVYFHTWITNSYSVFPSKRNFPDDYVFSIHILRFDFNFIVFSIFYNLNCLKKTKVLVFDLFFFVYVSSCNSFPIYKTLCFPNICFLSILSNLPYLHALLLLYLYIDRNYILQFVRIYTIIHEDCIYEFLSFN